MQRAIRVVRTFSLGLAFALGASQVSAAGALAIDSNQGEQYGFAYQYADCQRAVRRMELLARLALKLVRL